MLSNAYFLAKFRLDTAENEPAKNLQNFRKKHFSKMHFSKMRFSKRGAAGGGGGGPRAGAGLRRVAARPPRGRGLGEGLRGPRPGAGHRGVLHAAMFFLIPS